ncbi:uncharacterized protein LOC118477571 [Aplysia californica]|uniref:Uncharacterized protein LOC118477571 n=1 Tax=Aplysia californica TaxID=6500 RepID=A0ABM1VS70_APLCA|nr:uncharacterized protein LOC118477571 [Aplysia californica]
MVPNPDKPKRQWAKQFPTDQFLNNLKEAVTRLEGKRLCFVCDSRKQVTDATMFCYECDTYFCDNCDEAHRHMPKMQHHTLASLAELTPTQLLKNKKRSCTIHEGKNLELFCNVRIHFLLSFSFSLVKVSRRRRSQQHYCMSQMRGT